MALVDVDSKFIWINNKGGGHYSDGKLSGESNLRDCVSDKYINVHDDGPVANNGRGTPYLGG